MTEDLREWILEDDYPVYPGYWYIVDGIPTRSEIKGNIQDLKNRLNASEIKRCDIVGRNHPKS